MKKVYFLLSMTFLFGQSPSFAFGPTVPVTDPSNPNYPQWRAEEDKRHDNLKLLLKSIGTSVKDYLANPPLNPCRECIDESCNQKFADAQAKAAAPKLQKCPCKEEICNENLARTISRGLLKVQPTHTCLTEAEVAKRDTIRRVHFVVSDLLAKAPLNTCSGCANAQCNENFVQSQIDEALAAGVPECPCNAADCIRNLPKEDILTRLLNRHPLHNTLTAAQIAQARLTKAQSALDAAEAQAAEALKTAIAIQNDPHATAPKITLALTILESANTAVENAKASVAQAAQAVHAAEAAQTCFPGETLISIKDDSLEGNHSKPIDSIQVGDSVMSCNLKEGIEACEFRKVEGLIQTHTDHLIRLSFGGEILRATDQHPFYVVNKKGWFKACDLQVGDQLVTGSGEIFTVDEVNKEYGTFKVYNLNIEGLHNYYASNILVHDCTVVKGESPIKEVVTSVGENTVNFQNMTE